MTSSFINRAWLAIATAWLLASLANTRTFADTTQPQRQRWAVIATEPIGESGLADLLTTFLSQDHSDGQAAIDLVERDELDNAVRELELSQLLGAGDTEKQLQLGMMLRADVLVLLSEVEREKKRLLRMLIIDTEYAARLREEYFPWDPENVATIAEESSTVVGSVRRQYADGVQRVVAISPFISNN